MFVKQKKSNYMSRIKCSSYILFIAISIFFFSCASNTAKEKNTSIESPEIVLVQNPLFILKNCNNNVLDSLPIAYLKCQNSSTEDTLEYKLIIDDRIICNDIIIIKKAKDWVFKEIFEMKCTLPDKIFQHSDTLKGRIEFSSNYQSIQFKTIDIIQSEAGDTLSYTKYFPDAQRTRTSCCARLAPTGNKILEPGEKYGIEVDVDFKDILTEQHRKLVYSNKKITFTNVKNNETIEYQDTSRCEDLIPLEFDQSLLKKVNYFTNQNPSLETVGKNINLEWNTFFTVGNPKIPSKYSNLNIENIPLEILDSLWLTYSSCLVGFVKGETINKIIHNCEQEQILDSHEVIIRYQYGSLHHLTPR